MSTHDEPLIITFTHTGETTPHHHHQNFDTTDQHADVAAFDQQFTSTTNLTERELTVTEPPDREPDYRFTLANERTFLAWIRTSLGLLAAGVAVRQFVPPFGIPGATTALALMCVALAAVVAAASFPRWRRVQRAMRAGKPLPHSRMAGVLAAGVLLMALLAAVLVISG